MYYSALFFNTFFQNVWSVYILCLCCTISMMHFFRVALFSCSSFFVFHYFHCALSLCCTFLCCVSSWCTLSMFQFFHIGLFSYFAISFAFHVFFVLHLFHVAVFPCFSIPMLLIYVDSFHVALSPYCTLFMCNVMRELLENLGAIASFSCAV